MAVPKIPKGLLTGQEGQTMAEYAVVLGVITIAVVLALSTLAGVVSDGITTVAGLI
jgi:Flp pilus assembly pilin Flp